MDILTLIIIFLAGILASFIGGITSGGGGFISILTLLYLGLPPQVAIATDRFGQLGWVASTIYTFQKAKKIVYTHVIPLSIVSVIGALIGANMVVTIDEQLLQKTIGIFILLLLPIVVFKKDAGIIKKTSSKKRTIVGYILFFALAIYDGFFGVAGGMLVSYLFIFVFGFTFLQANATEKIPYLFNILVALSIFIFHDIVHYVYGIVLLVGNLVGGYFGASLAVKKGNNFVRIVFFVVVLVAAVRLLIFG